MRIRRRSETVLVEKNVVEKLAHQTSSESRGVVFTRLEVVEFILNLAGYTENPPCMKKDF
jgi:predicted helicase